MLAGVIRAAVQEYEAATGRPVAPGETIHINHAGCPAGEDRRRRLYVTRKITDSGTVRDLAYCHNCGEGTAVGGAPSNARAIAAGLGLGADAPLDLEAAYNALDLVRPNEPGFPIEATAFIAPIVTPAVIGAGHGLWSAAGLLNSGIGFNRATGRLVLPLFNHMIGEGGQPVASGGDHIVGWQERRLWGTGPKYTTTDGGSPIECEIKLWDKLPECVVFTEDYVSAVRVAQACCVAIAVPLLRYKARAEHVAGLYRSIGLPAVVWLDNDRPEVTHEALHLARLWRAMGGKAEVVSAVPEPKKASTFLSVNGTVMSALGAAR